MPYAIRTEVYHMTLLNALPGAVSQGMLWGIMAIGLYITFRVINISDLTVDGSLASGGATCVMLIRSGMNVWIAIFLATVVGMLTGLVTGLLHTRCGIPAILSGILTQLALYSVNLRIMDSKANQPVSVDKYHLLVSQRYVRELSLRNPMILLTIIIVSLIAQGMHYMEADSLDAVAASAYLHGLAGDIAAEKKGQYGMTSADLADAVAEAIKEVTGF